MTLTRIAAGAALAVACPGLAQAEDKADRPAPRIEAALTLGSLGAGPEFTFRPSPVIGLRASATFLGVNHTFGVNDIDYRGQLRLGSYGGTVDLYPFRNGLRLSAGLRVNRNKVRLSATPNGPVTVGQLSFTPAQIGTLTGTVTVPDLAPVLTVGYRTGKARGVTFAIDGGVMLQGTPRMADLAANGTLASDPAFQAQLADEQTQVNARIDQYKVYPVLQLSLGYGF
ncbi:hypothetical protein ACFOON_09660 [Novosphingobium piscinae]|uniref:Outer membrane protein beta-barrel domain-containing protein n=1 Tax=Novosphingobium piscinae TaxID=1507448 RepID=A0A7X1G1D7_9SPHN|nr:hypothetical protein [Novosphingobium piscinae]MBC2670836.1 hypothetical protein [Novosphingobium piscinae]